MSYSTDISGTVSEVHKVWKESRDLIPPAAREEIANAIFADAEITRASLNRRITLFMRHFFMGNIPPVLEPVLLRWMELQQRNLEVMHQEQGTQQLAGFSGRQAILETISAKQIAEKRTVQFLISADEIRKPELAEVEVVAEPVLITRETG